MITKEKTKEFIDRAYKCACDHGFHDKELSVEHYLMLVITEVSEAVEADRKNLKANFGKYERELNKYEKLVDYDTRFKCAFEKYVKNSVGDELADVCIRLYDFCGEMGILPDGSSIRIDGDLMEMWDEEFGSCSVCEQCYKLVRSVSSVDVDSSEEEMSEMVGACLLFCYCFAEHHGIDLERHIELKMQYNESRPVRHGKKY